MTIESAQTGLRRTRERAHSHGVVCEHANSLGLRLDFSASDDGYVQARFDCGRPFEGYAGIVQDAQVKATACGKFMEQACAGAPGATFL